MSLPCVACALNSAASAGVRFGVRQATCEDSATMDALPADPTVLHPMPEQPRVVLLKPLVTSPLIEVGEYSYYDDPDEPTAFETRNVLYHYGPEKLVIGRFCALGDGRAVHHERRQSPHGRPVDLPVPDHGRRPGPSTSTCITGLPGRGDTVVGNDVWFGYGATVMPGVRDRPRRDRRRRRRRHRRRPRLRHRRRQPGPAHPHPLQRGGHRPPARRRPGGTGPREHITEHVRTIMSGQHRRARSRRAGPGQRLAADDQRRPRRCDVGVRRRASPPARRPPRRPWA